MDRCRPGCGWTERKVKLTFCQPRGRPNRYDAGVDDPRPTPASPPPRRKDARTARNDERILDAVVDLLDRRGFAAVSASAVSKGAGTSIRPVRDRFPHRSAMVAAAWTHRFEPALLQALAPFVHAAADPSGLDEAIAACLVPHALARTAAETLLLASVDPHLRDVVDAGIAQEAAAWTDPSNDPLLAAKRAYLVALGLGALLVARRPDAAHVRTSTHAAALTAALSVPRDTGPFVDHRPGDLPPLPPPFHTGEGGAPTIDTGDATLDRVLVATLTEIARYGFDGVTVQRIASVAGVSEGYVYARYPSKVALFVEATTRQVPRDFRAWQRLVAETTASHGPGVAEAVQLRELQRDTRAWARVIAYEQRRLGFHDERLRTAEEDQLRAFERNAVDEGRSGDEARDWVHLEFALGTGIIALPILAPRAWTLPYDVVTVPLLGSTA